MKKKKKRRIYLLSERELPPEAIAVAFAKTSRSSKPFDEIAKELSEEQSKKFHERWTVGFGHGSIAEHAVLHIAIENVSRLAVEAIEANRLCSYTEKSSRYQEFASYYIPQEIERSEFRDLYIETCEHLFETYHRCLARLRAAKRVDALTWSRANAHVHDVCRFLLPTAALANLGMTANARNLEWAITKMLSHPLREVRQISEELKQVAMEETPTLVKYGEANPYLMKTTEALTTCTRVQVGPCARSLEKEPLTLIDYDEEAEERLVAALLYQFSRLPFAELLEHTRKMPPEEKEEIIDQALNRLGPHDRPLRELEHIYYTFDCLVDQGAYRDLSRHRMMTQTAQPPTVDYGYAIPRAIEEAGLRQDYQEAIDRATSAHREIYQRYPDEAAYLVTNAHNRRFLMTLNLRELYHLVSLRSRAEGHFSYRRIALAMFELAKERHPLLLRYLPFKEEPPSSAALEREYFASLREGVGALKR